MPDPERDNEMPSTKISIADPSTWVAREMAVSDWLTIDPAHLELFHRAIYISDVDVDLQYNRNNPLGDEIIDGSMLISILSHFFYKIQPFDLSQGAFVFNYGLDRVRFLTPVTAGQRVRCRIRLVDVREKREGQYLIKTENTLEIDGSSKPAMVAVKLNLFGVSQRNPNDQYR